VSTSLLVGPAIEIDYLPSCPHGVAAVFDADLGTSLFIDAVRALVEGGRHPALARAVAGKGSVLICGSEDHLDLVAEELEDLGAEFHPLGHARLVGPYLHRLCCRPGSRRRGVQLRFKAHERLWRVLVIDDDGPRTAWGPSKTGRVARALAPEMAAFEGVALVFLQD